MIDSLETTILRNAATSVEHSKKPKQSFIRKGAFAAGILLIIVVGVAFAPLLAPYDPLQQNILNMLQPPSSDHLFGTDMLGRDILSRVLWGGMPPLAVGVTATFLAMGFGVCAGIIAGYFGGVPDSLLSRLADIQMSIPGLVLALLVLALFGSSLINLIVVIAIESWPLHFRVVRAHVQSVRQMAYLEAARLALVPTPFLLWRHVLPGAAPLLAVTVSINFATGVLAQAGLSFLGIGVQPPTADWGMMVAEGQTQLSAAWWISAFPGAALLLLLLATQMLGDSLAKRSSIHGY